MTESTTVSIKLDDMTLEQLVQVSQGLGREIDRMREQRAHLKAKIDARLAAGERTCLEISQPAASGDAVAPGAVIDTAAGG